MTTESRCGMVALAGRPNVGKSTLLNRLLGQKVSIVTPRPQTTRHRITGIKTEPGIQLVFVDTPGLHKGPRNAMNRHMNRVAAASLAGVDLVVFVVEALKFTGDDAAVLERIRTSGTPAGLVVNKIDRVRDKSNLLPYLEEMSGRFPFEFVVPVSAESGDNCDALEREIRARMPESPLLYPEDRVTDRDMRFIASEVVREKLMLHLQQEVPYGVTVEIERYTEGGERVEIDAVVWVDKVGHKPIVIGEGGAMLRTVGRSARLELKRMLERPVHLNLWVKVREGWADDEHALKRFGYES